MGECGLDYHYDHSPRDVQRRAFAEQVRLTGGRPRPHLRTTIRWARYGSRSRTPLPAWLADGLGTRTGLGERQENEGPVIG